MSLPRGLRGLFPKLSGLQIGKYIEGYLSVFQSVFKLRENRYVLAKRVTS